MSGATTRSTSVKDWLLESERIKKVAIASGYVGFFVIALVFFLYFTFPTERLRGFVERQARTQGYELRIGSMQLAGVGGVVLENVDLVVPDGKAAKSGLSVEPGGAAPESDRKGPPKPGGPADEPPPGAAPKDTAPKETVRDAKDDPARAKAIHIDRIEVHLALLRALFAKTIDAKIDADIGAGEVRGAHVLRSKSRLEIDVPEIKNLPLKGNGLLERALKFQDKLNASLDGYVSGRIKFATEGGFQGAEGEAQLTIEGATLRVPVFNANGQPFQMTDLRMGTLTIKVRVAKKKDIPLLQGQRGPDDATALHIETFDTSGDDIEFTTEERSHVLVPAGEGGMKNALLQLHFAFAFQDLPPGKKPDGDKLAWKSAMNLMGDKLKPFERNGFVGMTCAGPLSKPDCRPSIPQVRVGVRKGAKEGDKGKEGEKPEAKGGEDKPGAKVEAQLPPAPSPGSFKTVEPPKPEPPPPPPPEKPPEPKREEKQPEPPAPREPAPAPPASRERPATDDGGGEGGASAKQPPPAEVQPPSEEDDDRRPSRRLKRRGFIRGNTRSEEPAEPAEGGGGGEE